MLAGGGTAIALAGGSSSPQPKPLDQAIVDAVSAPPVAGISADLALTSNLFPPGTLLGKLADGFLTGSGHIWASDSGQGRIDLQTGGGVVSAAWDGPTLSVYVAALNTVYRVNLPQMDNEGPAPTLSEIDAILGRIGQTWNLSQPQPGVLAGEPSYTVSASPKQTGSLLSSIRITWDAEHGTPLRAAVYAQGTANPVLELDVTGITYGAVPTSDLHASFPATASVTDLGSIPHGTASQPQAVSGLDAVDAAAGFPVAAPDSLAGLSRSSVTLRDGTVVIGYGHGIDGILLVEHKADASTTGHGFLDNLPSVSVGGVNAHEVTTALGSALTWQASGTTFLLAGSVPSAALEEAVSQVQ